MLKMKTWRTSDRLRVLFFVHQLDLPEGVLTDPLWSDMPRQMPDGSWISVGDVALALKGESFEYYPVDNKFPVPVELLEDSLSEFRRCNNFYYKFSVLGLPHGSGWANETYDCVHVLCLFDRWVKITQNYYEQKACER